MALAAVRSTREAEISQGGEKLPVIVGVPIKGEKIDGEAFDGKSETAIFPGDLPKNPAALYGGDDRPELNFVRFRPPPLDKTAEGMSLSLPHIRLDRTLEFLFGDYLA